MNFLSNFVIILVVMCFTNSHQNKIYYIEDYCNQEFVSLSPNQSNPIILYLTRETNTGFGPNYCILTLNTSQEFYIQLEGHLGKLMLDSAKSDDKRLHFVYNSNITQNMDITEKILATKLIVIIENNENNTQPIDKGLQTELLFRAVLKRGNSDCDEFNEAGPCMNTEEEMEESSGDFSPNGDCSGNDCSGESFDDCEDDETNCATKLTRSSGSGYLQLNQFLFILCSLLWLSS